MKKHNRRTKRFALYSGFLAMFWATGTIAQSIVQPEECILKTLQGGAKQENAYMIRYNCVRQYIRSVEPSAVSVPLENFADSRIEWFPEMPALPDPIPEKIIIRIKNNSTKRIISADVVLADARGKSSHSYRAYADYPVDPGTVGMLRADILTGTSSEKAIQSFWKTHTWAFSAVYGVAP